MTIEMLKGKIHRATVIQAELDYVGSITVDEELLEAAGILEYEKVQIVDVNNGSRFETYTISGERGSGMICLNGAAARCVSTGDKITMGIWSSIYPKLYLAINLRAVFVDEKESDQPRDELRTPRASQRYGHIKSSTIIQIVFRDNSDFRKEPISES